MFSTQIFFNCFTCTAQWWTTHLVTQYAKLAHKNLQKTVGFKCNEKYLFENRYNWQAVFRFLFSKSIRWACVLINPLHNYVLLCVAQSHTIPINTWILLWWSWRGRNISARWCNCIKGRVCGMWLCFSAFFFSIRCSHFAFSSPKCPAQIFRNQAA